MRDFIQRLYELDNFPVYLGIIIVILLIIFIIVYFLGKKDNRKLEETKKIEKITDDAFKETSVTEQVEVPVNKVNPFLVNTNKSEMTFPSIPIKTPEVPVIEEELRAPEIQLPDLRAPEIEEPIMHAPEIELELRAKEIIEESSRAPQIEEPIMHAPIIEIEDEIDQKIDKFNELASSIEKELNEIEKPVLNEEEEPILPELKNETKTIDVYSSVYGPKKEVELTNDTTEIELPRLKQ